MTGLPDSNPDNRETVAAPTYWCGCREFCGDSTDNEDGTCKRLPEPPKPPLVEIVLVPR